MASSASDTTASSATATAPRNWRVAASCWAWQPANHRLPRPARITGTAAKNSPALRCGNVRSVTGVEWKQWQSCRPAPTDRRRPPTPHDTYSRKSGHTAAGHLRMVKPEDEYCHIGHEDDSPPAQWHPPSYSQPLTRSLPAVPSLLSHRLNPFVPSRQLPGTNQNT